MAAKKQLVQKAVRENDPNVIGLHATVVDQDINDTLETNYMPYAMSVIVSRAIPEIDGFKPSHRKLLYMMYKMGLLTGNRTKSANIVGQTMRLNPHGDSAIYDTMVRLSKGYGALLTPFVDSKGNFGKCFSRDMAWAASRYTEAKLSSICSELFKDIDSDTVDFIDNYDGTMKEPALLPTTFPNILVSSNLGIAVGMASSICGFNLGEVCDTTIAYIRNKKCNLFDTLPAPDFPTGGELLNDRRALESIYETGKGSVKVRGKWRYVKESNVIEIYEIPYSTTSESIIDKVADLIKSGKLKEISDMRDETDLNGLKLAIDLKRNTDPDKVMAKLFHLTPLQDSFSCNFNILVNGVPKVLGIKQILDEWLLWRSNSVKRRVNFDLTKKKEKLHLLNGLKNVLLDIDRTIAIIRNSSSDNEVISNLSQQLNIDATQAEYVAEIKLRNLNKDYITKRIAEIEDIQREVERLSNIVANPNEINKLIIQELTQVKKKYAESRKTSIIDVVDAPIDIVETKTDYDVNVLLTNHWYIKKQPSTAPGIKGVQKMKEDDSVRVELTCKNSEEVIFFTNKCQVYKLRLCDLEECKSSSLGEYVPTKLGMEKDEYIIQHVFPHDYSGNLLMVFSNGKIAKVALNGYQTTQHRKKLQNAYATGCSMVAILPAYTDVDVMLTTKNNRYMYFNSKLLSVKAARNSSGVTAFTLSNNDAVSSSRILRQDELSAMSKYKTTRLPSSGAKAKSVEKTTLFE